MGDKVRETRLNWFKHAQSRPATTPIRKCLVMQVDGPPTGRGKTDEDMD